MKIDFALKRRMDRDPYRHVALVLNDPDPTCLHSLSPHSQGVRSSDCDEQQEVEGQTFARPSRPPRFERDDVVLRPRDVSRDLLLSLGLAVSDWIALSPT